jgi:hypothetical protein
MVFDEHAEPSPGRNMDLFSLIQSQSTEIPNKWEGLTKSGDPTQWLNTKCHLKY